MAIYWYDSFQDYSIGNVSGPQGAWDYSQYAQNSTELFRTGTCAYLACIPGGVAGGSIKRFGVNRTDSTIGLAVNFGGTHGSFPSGSSWSTICSFMDSSFSGSWTDNCQIQLQLKADGSLRVCTGTNPASLTVLGTSTTTPLSVSGWHYVEFYVLIHPSAGAFTVRVDGVVVNGLQLTGQNTRSTANTWINGFGLGAAFTGGNALPLGTLQNNGIFYANDLYILDSSGSAPNNTFLGDVKVLHAWATANGGTNNFAPQAATWLASNATVLGAIVIDSNGKLQKCTANTGDTKTGGTVPTWATTTGATTTDNHVTWTLLGTPANFMYIDSPNYSGDAQAFLADSTIGDVELYNFNALTGVPAGVTQVYAAGIDIRAAKDQTSVRSIRGYCSSSGVTADSGADLPLVNGVFTAFKPIITTDPNTGSAWTVAGVNAAKFGAKVSA